MIKSHGRSCDLDDLGYRTLLFSLHFEGSLYSNKPMRVQNSQGKLKSPVV